MHRRRNLACEPFSEASDEACPSIGTVIVSVPIRRRAEMAPAKIRLCGCKASSLCRRAFLIQVRCIYLMDVWAQGQKRFSVCGWHL